MGYGRVRSFATGKGGARKADADLLKGGKKKKMRKGLYANIHAKRKRGGKMRKKGAKGAPTAENFRRAKQTVRKK